MNKALYDVGMLAIPIKDENYTGDYAPNYLIVQGFRGDSKILAPFENPLNGGTIEIMPSLEAYLRLEYRRVKEDGGIESIIIRNIVQPLPLNFIPLVSSYQVLKEQKPLATLLLNMFDFPDSIIEGLILKLDSEVLDQIIENEEKVATTK